MKLYFSENQKMNELNKIEFEDLMFVADYIEGDELDYTMVGVATIDNETYNDFVIAFTLTEKPNTMCVEDILDTEWDFYDYTFS